MANFEQNTPDNNEIADAEPLFTPENLAISNQRRIEQIRQAPKGVIYVEAEEIFEASGLKTPTSRQIEKSLQELAEAKSNQPTRLDRIKRVGESIAKVINKTFFRGSMYGGGLTWNPKNKDKKQL